MPINTVILSLPKDSDRRQACRAELTQLGLDYTFKDAVAGNQIPDSELDKYYDADLNRSKFKRPLTRNEIACALGHQQIWQDIARSDNSLTLVLEDDMTFVSDPRTFLNQIADCAEWFEGVMIKLDGATPHGRHLTGISGQDLMLTDHLPPRTTGYLLGRDAAARLVERSAPIARPVDIDLKFYWEHNVPVLTLKKQMIAERPGNESNLSEGRRKNKPGSPLRRFLRNLTFQAKYKYGRMRHPLRPETIKELNPLLNGDSRNPT